MHLFHTHFKLLFYFILHAISLSCYGQFAGEVGQPNTTAIHKDSSIIVGWANQCHVDRGYMNIADPSLGFTDTGTDNLATGKADEYGVVSLGDSGVAILTFPHPIFNGFGPDIVIFENAFSDAFLELAFVEVSSDGTNFYRFPASSFLQTQTQFGPWQELSEAEKIHNLAGKYRSGYGTPFDLDDLVNEAGLDVNHITHVKIIDVIGSIQPMYGSTDQNGNLINDPYPTDFSAGGFDLDAVGACYFQSVNDLTEIAPHAFSVFPNPFTTQITVSAGKTDISKIKLFNSAGVEILETVHSSIFLQDLSSGTYVLEIYFPDGNRQIKQIIKL